MPRGQGKKENYNLNYERFNYLDRDDDDDSDNVYRHTRVKAASGEDATPPLTEILKTMPPELQQAYHLHTIAKETRSEEAQQRANQLALQAVMRGDEKVKEDFIKNLYETAPQVAAGLGYSGEGTASVDDILATLAKGDTLKQEAVVQEVDFNAKVEMLRAQMLSGQEHTRKQLEQLQKQQQKLERLRTPEDITKFMSEGGLKPEDLQRIFSGDTAFMEQRIGGMLDEAVETNKEGVFQNDQDQAIQAAEDLHRIICGDGDLTDTSIVPPVSKEMLGPKRGEQVVPLRAVTVPIYRLQYQKDDDGKYSAVELRCTLPGITDMTSIVLDVSVDHLRLSTLEPAPGYVVNAGPFPVGIDPDKARAKFSKKKEELHIMVPARPRA